jgi:quinol monooxygenase YgiN
MAQLATFVKLVAKEGRRQDLVAGLNDLLNDVVEHEPKCEAYIVHLDNDDSNAVWIYELYSGPEGLVDHRAGSVLQRLREEVFPEIVAETTSRHWGTPVSASGLTTQIRPPA